MKRASSLFSATAMFLVFCGAAIAANPVNWSFDTETKGEDVSWSSSPQYVDNCYTVYEYSWEITKLEAYTKILLFWTWVDISFLLDNVSGSGVHHGCLPATVLDERISEGEVGADVNIEVDENGYGHAYVTNITLGTVQGINVQGVRIEGTITITGTVLKPVKNTNQGTYFMEIQDAIDNANNSDVIVANPITYEENINFSGKNITVTGTEPQNPNIVAQTIIEGSGNTPTVKFQGGETSDCSLVGFTITGGESEGGIYGNQCGTNISYCAIRDNVSEFDGAAINGIDGIISNCTITGNATDLSMRGVLAECDGQIRNCLIANNSAHRNSAIYNCDADIINCTIADNISNYGAAVESCNGRIVNSIIYYNQPAESVANCPDVSFCCLESYKSGAGNIYEEPDFVSQTDYHLASQAGSWDYVNGIWSNDSITSKCIDAGGSSFSLGDEYSHANNLRVNMGVYGGTAQASKSPVSWSIIADITNDGIVNFDDYAWLVEYFMNGYDGITGDLNRDEMVDIDDLSIMSEKWLQETSWH